MADAQKLIDLIGTVAPSIGKALGGPLAGAALELLAQILGAKGATPGDVTAAIESTDPKTVKARLESAEAQFKAAAEEAVTMRSQIAAHLEMVKLDYARGWFWSAGRPASVWAAWAYGVAVCSLVVRDIYFRSYDIFTYAAEILMIGAPLMALAGIYVWRKTDERRALAGAAPGNNVVDAIRSILRRK